MFLLSIVKYIYLKNCALICEIVDCKIYLGLEKLYKVSFIRVLHNWILKVYQDQSIQRHLSIIHRKYHNIDNRS